MTKNQLIQRYMKLTGNDEPDDLFHLRQLSKSDIQDAVDDVNRSLHRTAKAYQSFRDKFIPCTHSGCMTQHCKVCGLIKSWHRGD
jgi:hypothetical protein